ncbi:MULTISPECIES: arginyltransferase [unclassified Ruegeria]|uniref:arginyltransferase n=1 Tax=unclassified Ruegeria TaxID=2625375 RepID=UPI001ADB4C9B|nr:MULTISPECIES: arginyltransferase [unclassified Ruegeria]MBO9410449.1 arginyltransferase [Ruegeria sp. R8_1]MBO9414332.1 arginyltransferase [Ruegeria sp. R8_2]
MRHTLPIAPQFYVTAPQPCPYLEGRMERKLFTALQGEGADQLNNSLSQQGFRRSQNVLYRPSCADCAACLSARIDVSAFAPSKSQKRAVKRNAFLQRKANSPWATDEQYELFRRYLDTRHADGGMADMDVFEFAAMIEETPIRSRVVEYADPDTDNLIAVSLTDVLDDGLSMVYSFYDPHQPQNSLGTYMILDHIDIAREAGLPYVYLGYWVPGSPKMGYKARFSGLEAYIQGEWVKVGNPDDLAGSGHHPLSTAPIAEQVANIQLPDRHPTKG